MKKDDPGKRTVWIVFCAGVLCLAGSLLIASAALVIGIFLILYGIWLTFSQQASRIIPFAFAIITTTLFFLLWPAMPLGDDAAIVLKYMDNFARGYFYSYNPQDGPVFGVSGFVHGVIAGGLAYSHLFTPTGSMFASNFVGLLLVCYLSFRILAWHVGEGDAFIFPLWGLLLLTSEPLILNGMNGLETPLHLALLLGCVFLYLKNNTRMLLLLSVVACISKLDAVPVVATLAVANLLRNRNQLRMPALRKEYFSTILLYGVLPLLLWVLVSTLLFGTPFPQSAYAKYMYHRSTSQHWFPFLESLFLEKNRPFLGAAVFACVAYMVTLALAFRRNGIDRVLTQHLYGVLLAATLLLYYVFNPAERMGWYYVVPAFFAALQGILLLHEWLLKRFVGYAVPVTAALIVCYAAVGWPRLESLVSRYASRVRVVESERQAIGDWVRQQSGPDDTLLTGFGHIAQRAGLYTVDYSGLNSRIATDLRLNIPSMVQLLKPQWIVLDTLLAEGESVRGAYDLRRSFFNLASLGRETWRVYGRRSGASDTRDMQLPAGMVAPPSHAVPLRGGGIAVSGRSISFPAIGGFHASGFVVGLRRDSVEVHLSASFYGAGGIEVSRHSVTLEKQDKTSYVDGYTKEWAMQIPPGEAISAITVAVTAPPGGSVEILSPTLVDIRRND